MKSPGNLIRSPSLYLPPCKPRHTLSYSSSQAGGLPDFALGHIEKIIDYAYRALKETMDTSKTIIAALTGPRR
jgi:hypothetical protein